MTTRKPTSTTRKSSKLRRVPSKYKLLFIAFGVIIFTASMLLVLHETNRLSIYQRNPSLYTGDNYPLQLRLQPKKTIFKKSEFVRIEVKATNVSDYTVGIPWGTCGDVYKIILDRQHNILGDPSFVCGIGGGIPPGQTVGNKLLELNLSHMESGIHTISMEYTNPNIKSNEIEIELKASDPIYDCYSYADDITTLCYQAMIKSNTDASAEEDNKNCRHIQKKFLSKSYPLVSPIPSLSTESCDEGRPAVFVFNMPYKHSTRFYYEIENAKDNDKVCRSTNYSNTWFGVKPSRSNCF